MLVWDGAGRVLLVRCKKHEHLVMADKLIAIVEQTKQQEGEIKGKRKKDGSEESKSKVCI